MRAEGARRTAAVRLRRFGAALLLAGLPAAAGAGEPPGDAAVLDAFGRIAFGNEFVVEADPRLKKWTAPIRWRVYAEVPLDGAERDFLDRHLARLERLTGLMEEEALARAGQEFVVVLMFGQALLMVGYAVFVTFPGLGRNYDAAVIAAGHCGFGLGATPTAIANMQAVTERFGSSHLAFLVVPMVGAFFIDIANAIVIKLFLALPLFSG